MCLFPCLLFLSFLSACSSPYKIYSSGDVPVETRMTGPDLVELIPSRELKTDCQRRDAILFKAAAVAMENNFTHFEFVGEPALSYSEIASSRHRERLIARLCRGPCSGYGYSADAIVHVLLPKYRPPGFPVLGELYGVGSQSSSAGC
jgi:hypothetical protein